MPPSTHSPNTCLPALENTHQINSCPSPPPLNPPSPYQVFRSKDYNALLYALGQLFNKVEATKPQVNQA